MLVRFRTKIFEQSRSIPGLFNFGHLKNSPIEISKPLIGELERYHEYKIMLLAKRMKLYGLAPWQIFDRKNPYDFPACRTTFDPLTIHTQHSGRMKSLNVRTPGDRL